MAANAPEYESKLIVLTQLNNEIEDALKIHKKWVTVIDKEGNAEVFFKYQGTSVFSILEKEVAPESLCRSILIMAKYPRTLTINYLDLPYQNVFNETYFPEEVLDHSWVANYKNLDKLRANFPQEFPEEIWACQDFKICFLFRKDNVPAILHEKTIVLEICPPGEIAEMKAEREEKRLAKQNQQKEEEEKKVEEPKKTNDTPTKAKTPAVKSPAGKTGSATKSTSSTHTTNKTTAPVSSKTTSAATTKTTGATPTKPVTTSKPASTTAPKTTSTTTGSAGKAAVATKTVKK